MRFISLFILMIFISHPCVAEDDIHARLEQKKAEHAALVKKSKALEGEVGSIKQKLVSTGASIRKTENNIAKGEQRLKDLRQKKSEYVSTLYADQNALGSLVTGAQKMNATPTSQLLMTSRPIDAARAALIMKSAIPELHNQSKDLKEKLQKLASIEDDISGEVSKQEKEYKKIKGQKDELSGLLDKKDALYKETESERKAQEIEVQKLAREAKNLDDLLLKIKKRSKKSATIRLPDNMLAPVSGAVRTAFGDTDDTGAKSKGLTFDTTPGATVIIPLSGKVVFAGPFQKYKQILIVEHQGGYHSLIAGLGRIDTVVGDTLSAGEPVGTAEKSEDGAESIYYELRQNGEPVDPLRHLVAKRK